MADVQIYSDWSSVDKELDRLDNLLDAEGKARLEAVLDLGFEDTQAQVDIITMSLKRSGKTSSETNASGNEWTGEITYGGASPGSVNDPVDYARYEQNRGGGHDFMRNLDHLHSLWEEAVSDTLRGRV